MGWAMPRTRIRRALVGSCTNSSYEDISRAADLARQAAARGAKARIPFLVTPGSEMVRATIERDGQLQDLESIGAVVLANACGPCIGQWRRDDITPAREGDPPKRNSIVSLSTEFSARNDGSNTFCPDESGGGVAFAWADGCRRSDGVAGGRHNDDGLCWCRRGRRRTFHQTGLSGSGTAMSRPRRIRTR